MDQTARGRISVDIGRLRVALFERARAEGVSPSHLVRDIVSKEIANSVEVPSESVAASPPDGLSRMRVSLRLTPVHAVRLRRTARRAGVSMGDVVADLLDGMPAPISSAERQAQLQALVVSNSELATLSRDLRHLGTLLARGSVAAAQRYRDLLDTVAADVRRHVDTSSAALAGLRSVARRVRAEKPGQSHE